MDSSSEDDMAMLVLYNMIRKRKHRRYWEHEIVKLRREYGAFINLVLNDRYADEFVIVLCFIGKERPREVNEGKWSICRRERLCHQP